MSVGPYPLVERFDDVGGSQYWSPRRPEASFRASGVRNVSFDGARSWLYLVIHVLPVRIISDSVSHDCIG